MSEGTHRNGVTSKKLGTFATYTQLEIQTLFARVIELEHRQGVERYGCACCSRSFPAHFVGNGLIPTKQHEAERKTWVRLTDLAMVCPECAKQHGYTEADRKGLPASSQETLSSS